MPNPLFKPLPSLATIGRYFSRVFNRKPRAPCPQEAAGIDPAVKTCSCHLQAVAEKGPPPTVDKIKKTARSVPSVLLSILVAFFPKCPMCWAAYMSMFGSVSLAQTPYQGWLFPVLLGFLGLHLFLIFRKVPEKGYGPFLLSVFGAIFIISSRALMLSGNALLIIGMLCILLGSLWNSFSFNRLNPSIAQ